MKTPQLPYPKLSKALGVTNKIWLKREDLHHYGSHKGRSIPLLIDLYRKEGAQNFVISSSGNAALAAAQAITAHNKNSNKEPLTLQIFVGKNIDKNKLAGLDNVKNKRIVVEQTDNPKQAAFLLAKEGKAKLLRQSMDDNALLGYKDLAAELAKIENLSAVFIPTSSGTTAQGLFEGFKELGVNPQIHIVQTEECHPMLNNPKSEILSPKSTSLASAIVDKIAHRKQKVLEAIKNSHGGGWVANNAEILKAQKLIKQTAGVDISPNSALSVVGLMHAVSARSKFEGPVVCLITGR